MSWLGRNWGIKIVSLFLAAGLWYYAVGEEDVEITRTVPLDLKVKNPQMSILKTPVQALQVTLIAPRALLSDLASEKIRAIHEIGAEIKTAGDYSFRIESSEIKLPAPQIRVLKIEPNIIRVALDEVIAKKIKINPHFAGEPAFGYKLGTEEIQLDPNAVLMEGPKGQLEKQESVETEKIDLVGRTRSFRRTVALDLPANVKPLSETVIDVYVPIREEFEEKSFQKVPVRVLRASEGHGTVKVDPAAVSFVLKGSKRKLDELTPEKILAYVDASSLEPGDHDEEVEIVLPEDVALKEEKPLMVKLTIAKG